MKIGTFINFGGGIENNTSIIVKTKESVEIMKEKFFSPEIPNIYPTGQDKLGAN